MKRGLATNRRAGPPIELISFEGFPAGAILSSVFTTAGSGPVAIRGYNPFIGLDTNAALIFDSSFPTGGDFDLGTPHVSFGGPGIGPGGRAGPFQNDEPQGKILIIGENLNDWEGDGLVNSPDDLNAAASPNATLLFDFAAVGSVTILGITIIDVEASEQPPIITYFDSTGATLGTAIVPATGDNGVAEVDLGGVTGVSQMLINMRGSGAVDDLLLRREEPGSIAFVRNLVGVDVTPDGGTALLFDLGSTNGNTYFYDTESGALELKTTVGSPFRDFPTGISGTRRVSAHHGDPVEAGLWTEAGGWLDLGNVYPLGCGVDQGSAWDISADGNAAVGLLWNECNGVAFRWTSAGGLMPLELLGASFPGSTNPPTNRATKISDDGAVVGGFAQTDLVDRWPALWEADGSGFLLPGGVFPVDAPGEVLSVSADGSMVAGIWNFEGFYWTESAGVVPLGLLPGALPGGQTFPNAIAASGQLIFGKASPGFFDPPVVFVWTAADGMRSLVDIAVANGVDIPANITLDNILAASTDGSVLVGSAFDFSFRSYAFVLKLPVSAYGL
ncbi:MAG: hypothetical protein HOP15_02660 [Planctomycetes bacterium]|nr:hypothetical protein [Planctomycetota bacterium]